MANGNGNASANDMVEIQSGGDIFKFDSIGASLAGKLEEKREAKRDDGSTAHLYDIRDRAGKLWTIWGTRYLDARLLKIPEGVKVEIEYVEDEPAKKKGWSPMKVFAVRASRSEIEAAERRDADAF